MVQDTPIKKSSDSRYAHSFCNHSSPLGSSSTPDALDRDLYDELCSVSAAGCDDSFFGSSFLPARVESLLAPLVAPLLLPAPTPAPDATPLTPTPPATPTSAGWSAWPARPDENSVAAFFRDVVNDRLLPACTRIHPPLVPRARPTYAYLGAGRPPSPRSRLIPPSD